MNEAIYTNDIVNRFPNRTLTKSVDKNGITIFEVKEGSTVIARSRGRSASVAVYRLRLRLVGDADILPIQTPIQRTKITQTKEGQLILVRDAGVSRTEFFDGTVWKKITDS